MALGKAVVGYDGTVATTAIVTLAENIDLTNYGYIQYNGTKYTSATSFTVNVGDTVTVYAGVTSGNGTSKITLNGKVVATKTAGASTYSLVITGDATISYTWEQDAFGYWVTITMDVPAPFAHDITKGKVLINGVAYDITQGKMLVNGVAYDIGDTGAVEITVTGTGASPGAYCSYCIINGQTYTSATSGIEAMSGDEITFGVYGGQIQAGTVTINGTAVYNKATSGEGTYIWEIPADTKKITIALKRNTGMFGYGSVTVTTE
jgi:hypothetical protein